MAFEDKQWHCSTCQAHLNLDSISSMNNAVLLQDVPPPTAAKRSQKKSTSKVAPKAEAAAEATPAAGGGGGGDDTYTVPEGFEPSVLGQPEFSTNADAERTLADLFVKRWWDLREQVGLSVWNRLT